MEESDRSLTARHKELIAVALRGFVLKKYKRSGGVNRLSAVNRAHFSVFISFLMAGTLITYH